MEMLIRKELTFFLDEKAGIMGSAELENLGEFLLFWKKKLFSDRKQRTYL